MIEPPASLQWKLYEQRRRPSCAANQCNRRISTEQLAEELTSTGAQPTPKNTSSRSVRLPARCASACIVKFSAGTAILAAGPAARVLG